MLVKLIQLLCPKRHAIIASIYESGGGSDDIAALQRMQATWNEMLARGEINPWCGICGSRDLTCEIGRTRFRTLKEAEPFFLITAQRNQAARLAHGQDRWRSN